MDWSEVQVTDRPTAVRPHERRAQEQQLINAKRDEFDRFWNEEWLPRVRAGIRQTTEA